MCDADAHQNNNKKKIAEKKTNGLTYLILNKWQKLQSAAVHVPFSGSDRYGYTTQTNNNSSTQLYLYNKQNNKNQKYF